MESTSIKNPTKWCPRALRTIEQIFENGIKICQKSEEMVPRSAPKAISEARRRKGATGLCFFGGFFAPLGRFLSILWTPENPTGHQKRPKKINTATFWCTLAAKGRKKEVLEGVWNRHEILMKNRCENGKLWDA